MNLFDLEASRDRTYYYCDNPAHAGLVRQTFFTEPGKYDAKCIGCGAVMTISRYTSEVETGWFKVNKAGLFETEVRYLDPIQTKFVMKIQKIIMEADAGIVPKELVEDLKRVLDDYLFERIKTLIQLRNVITALAAKTATTAKLDDAEICDAYDGACYICPRKGKCRFGIVRVKIV